MTPAAATHIANIVSSATRQEMIDLLGKLVDATTYLLNRQQEDPDLRYRAVAWVVLHNDGVICQRCGREHPLNSLMPLSLAAVSKLMDAYQEEHRHCAPGPVTYPRPVNPEGTVEQRAARWQREGETGISSQTIRRFMSGVGAATLAADPWRASPPQDPDDFRRCRLLLTLIPEWRPRIAEMAAVRGWERIALAWDELDALYDEEVPTGKGLAPKLYARMRELLAPAVPAQAQGGAR